MNSQPSILVMVAVLETDDSVAEPAAEGRGPRLRGEQPMQKKKAAKISGFVAALCASGTLVGMAVSGTGAYFTDSHDGAINASTGHVKVNVSDTTLNFANLLPGEPKTVNVDYVANGTGNEDIWLVLPTNGGADALTDDGNGDGLGRYGHFAVSAPAGSFTSSNLRHNFTSDQSSGLSCGVDANGHGGSNQEAANTNNSDPASYVPYCAAPHAILLSSNLAAGQGGTADVTFGYTKLLKGAQDDGGKQIATYKIVATQTGVRPDDVNNGS
jgi:hypothetical protein